LTEWITARVFLPVWPVAVLMLLAGCNEGSGTSVLFSNTSLEEVQAAYIDVLTEEVHPSRIDAGFDPIATEARLRRYCAALKEVAKNWPDKKTHGGKLEDHIPTAKGVRVLDECLPGRFWSNGVCLAQWTRVMNFLPSLRFARKEKATVSREDDGRVKLTVWHWQRDSFVSSVAGGRTFSWLWNVDPLVEKRRIAAVKKRISGGCGVRR